MCAAVVGLAAGVLVAQLRYAADDRDQTPAADEADPLYYAGGEIHDGETVVAYRPDGSVDDLVAVDSGWVLLEKSFEDTHKLVLVRRNGDSRTLDSGLIDTFDVSTDGSRIVYPLGHSTAVAVVDVKTGGVVERLSTGKAYPGFANFAGEDVIYRTGIDARDHMMRWDPATDAVTRVQSDKEPNAVSADGSRMLLARAGFPGRPCPGVFPTSAPERARWRECDVRGYAGSGAFNPSGSLLLATDPPYWRGRTLRDWRRWVAVLDSESGTEVGRIRGRLVAGAHWLGDDAVGVLVGEDRKARGFRMLTCTVDGECTETVPDLAGDAVLGRRD
ncbi:MAG: hypothetical protein GEU93_03410 [Propionibacteriales bacterium]|nr:hypothetical protein [Propionibacteriales bacterium]